MNTRLNSWRACPKKTEFTWPLKTIKQQLKWASDILYSISCSSRLDSEVLLAHCLQKDRSYLLTWPEQELTTRQQDCFQELVRRRLQPQPVAYLVGYREFYSMRFDTTPDTLVPRPETELLVDTVLELTQNLPSAMILELGTGTGAIALAIKKHNPGCQMRATDVSQSALEVARANAKKHVLDVQFVLSDWYQAIVPDVQFDIIVSNPPYVASNDPCLGQGDLPAEPIQALSSGDSGLEALEMIIAGAVERLKPGGYLLLEHGFEQAQAVTELLEQMAFEAIQTKFDFNDLERMTMARRHR